MLTARAVACGHGRWPPPPSQLNPSPQKRETSSAGHQLAKLLVEALAQANVRPEDRPHWRTRVQYGSPRVVVEKALNKADTDLLVLGTHGYSGAAYVFLGTVAGDLLRAAKCDILVVPASPSK